MYPLYSRALFVHSLAFAIAILFVVVNISDGGAVLSIKPTEQGAISNSDTVSTDSHVYLPLIQGPQTSIQLIDEALAKSEITTDVALLYKVYVAFGDERLPVAFQAANGGLDSATGLMLTVIQQYLSLPTETQQLLVPFLVPPYYEGSWYNAYSAAAQRRQTGIAGATKLAPIPPGTISGNWSYVDGETSPVRVWYQPALGEQEEIWANQIRNEMDARIWPKLTLVMDKEPLSDAGMNFNGGNGRFDIALADLPSSTSNGVSGRAMPYYQWYSLIGQVKSCPAPAAVFLLIGRWVMPNVEAWNTSLAHEVMHAINFAYKVKTGCLDPEYIWLTEATATWAEDYVYPSLNMEHEMAPLLMHVPEVPLESRENQHFYGAYLFPFYLAHKYGDEVNRTIWQQTESYDDSLAAIDAALGIAASTDLKTAWPEFARYNYNKEPETYYQQQDGLTSGAYVNGPMDVRLAGAETKVPLPLNIPHLGSTYYYLRFSDANIHGLSVYLNLHNRYETLNIHALVKLAGQSWQPWDPAQHDWTHESNRFYCQDKESERLEELVLIFSNSEWQDRAHHIKAEPYLYLSNIPCEGTWSGKFTYIDNCAEERGVIETIKANVVYKGPTYLSLNTDVFWNFEQGTVTEWTVSGTGKPSGCSYNMNVPGFTIGAIPKDSKMSIDIPYGRDASGIITSAEIRKGAVTRTCPKFPPEPWGERWFTVIGGGGNVLQSGNEISGISVQVPVPEVPECSITKTIHLTHN